MWKKTDEENWREEQHITLSKDANKKLEKMFASATKRPRFIPDDPYEINNKRITFNQRDISIKWFRTKHEYSVL